MRQIIFYTVLIFFVLAGLAGASGNGAGVFSVTGNASLQAEQDAAIASVQAPPSRLRRFGRVQFRAQP